MNLILKIIGNKYTAILWTITIFILCTLPSDALKEVNVYDKFAHLGVFAIFSFLWLNSSKNFIIIIISGIFYGIFIEFWQGILPDSFHRSLDWMDAIADAVGVVIGWIIFKIQNRFF